MDVVVQQLAHRFDRMYKEGQAELIAKTQREHDTMRQQFQHADQRHADAANLRLETARKEMVEQVQQQKKEFQDEWYAQNRAKMEEYRRDCDIASQLALGTHRDKVKMEVESQFLQKAKVYQKSWSDEFERERASLTESRKDRDSMSVIFDSMRGDLQRSLAVADTRRENERLK